MKRHCLEQCDEEGKQGDYVTPTNKRNSSEPSVKNGDLTSLSSSFNAAGTATGTATGSSNNIGSKSDLGTSTVPPSSAATFASSVPPMVAECEAELDKIIATMESVLSHLWAKDVDGVRAHGTMHIVPFQAY